MTDNPNNLVHVIFPLQQDGSGYPPFATERVWAENLGENKYKIKNTPFYAKGVSADDIVSVIEKEGALFFDKLLTESGNSTVRIIFFKDKSTEQEIQGLLKQLTDLGSDWEEDNTKLLYAINIPKNVDYQKIIGVLNNSAYADKFEYEESVVAHK